MLHILNNIDFLSKFVFDCFLITYTSNKGWKMMQVVNNSLSNLCKGHNIQTNKNLTFTSRGAKMNETPRYIENIISNLKKATTQDEMYKILDNAVANTSEFIATDLTDFAGSGYKFQCTLKAYTDRYDIKKINQESGRTIVDIIQIGNTDRCVVVSKAK